MFPQIDKEKTGKRLQNIMEKANMTIEGVKKYLGLSCVQTIYHWFEGKAIPSTDNLYALSELFKVPIDRMLCGNRTWDKKMCDWCKRTCCKTCKPSCEIVYEGNEVELYISNSMTSCCAYDRIRMYQEKMKKWYRTEDSE